MPDIYLTKTVAGLAAQDEDAKRTLRRFKVGDPVKVSITKPRNYEFHKKAMSLLRLGHENLPEKYGDMTFESYRKEMLKAIGWSTTYRDFQGREVVEADSMSFSRITEDQEFDDQVFQPLIGLTQRLIGVGREDLEMEVLSYAG